ncbi:AraC family transcriptional regulator ligand-binding domain-containing protein [Acinetobacter sp. B5B]|uniref:helix-turn-helix domain-containing protein n=1 Tax=Acinetobacter baretiae TaxID=2605383 RepID=UPI0018C1E78B|nr:AraC family transcriptional regulator [Acinetobacter baretiae]MBF7682561.1 AraC family transcriptional regulator ligand-binding domain-containing protein [Acinetobacter baretiae]MBF7686273.1 AraC family transcriptional regulator ligand-binding domain-containing protein [Acinetobacter baretiae]
MNYEHDHPFIPAHHQLSLLIDLSRQYHLDDHILLSGSGLFLQDILSANKKISYLQFMKVLYNAKHHFHSDDIHFLFGQRCLTTPFNHALKSILYAQNFEQVLQRCLEFHAFVCPWLTPKIMKNDHEVIIYWLNVPRDHEGLFLLEMSMSAFKALSRDVFGEKVAWQFDFNIEEPDYIEQYWSHLGDQLHFKQPISCMRLAIEHLQKPLQQYSFTLSSTSYIQAKYEIEKYKLQQSFLEAIYQYLMQHIAQGVSLESTAHHFSMSSATLKRKLKKHNSSFQAQIDQCRLHTAIILQRVHGFNGDQIAHHLAINDPTNFRRAFKRWCGLNIQQFV